MGHYRNIKTHFTAANGAALFLFGTTTILSTQALARNPEAQLYPAISLDTPLARDADTFETDKALTAACRKTGTQTPVCICVTHVMKYELTLAEYQVATRIYGQPKNRTTIHKVLKEEGFTKSEIGMVEELEHSLIDDKDFNDRCSEAKAYYKNPPS